MIVRWSVLHGSVPESVRGNGTLEGSQPSPSRYPGLGPTDVHRYEKVPTAPVISARVQLQRRVAGKLSITSSPKTDSIIMFHVKRVTLEGRGPPLVTIDTALRVGLGVTTARYRLGARRIAPNRPAHTEAELFSHTAQYLQSLSTSDAT